MTGLMSGNEWHRPGVFIQWKGTSACMVIASYIQSLHDRLGIRPARPGQLS